MPVAKAQVQFVKGVPECGRPMVLVVSAASQNGRFSFSFA